MELMGPLEWIAGIMFILVLYLMPRRHKKYSPRNSGDDIHCAGTMHRAKVLENQIKYKK